ncbi:hypothetical protein D3C80_2133940 [compost metagenome]
MPGMQVASIYKYRFARRERIVVCINLKQGFAFYTIENFCLIMPMCVHDMLSRTVTVPICAKRLTFITMIFDFFERSS